MNTLPWTLDVIAKLISIVSALITLAGVIWLVVNWKCRPLAGQGPSTWAVIFELALKPVAVIVTSLVVQTITVCCGAAWSPRDPKGGNSGSAGPVAKTTNQGSERVSVSSAPGFTPGLTPPPSTAVSWGGRGSGGGGGPETARVVLEIVDERKTKYDSMELFVDGKLRKNCTVASKKQKEYLDLPVGEHTFVLKLEGNE